MKEYLAWQVRAVRIVSQYVILTRAVIIKAKRLNKLKFALHFMQFDSINQSINPSIAHMIDIVKSRFALIIYSHVIGPTTTVTQIVI